MTQILISLSAEGFTKGDRCIVKAGRNEWYVGTIQTSGKKLKVLFDDGASATVEEDDFKDVKVLPGKVKKTKAALTGTEAKALIAQFKEVKEAYKSCQIE